MALQEAKLKAKGLNPDGTPALSTLGGFSPASKPCKLVLLYRNLHDTIWDYSSILKLYRFICFKWKFACWAAGQLRLSHRAKQQEKFFHSYW